MQFQIGFVAEVTEPRFELTRNRIYIPVMFRNELVGWQCRSLTPDRGPKYLNAPNMRKSALLYNYDQAATQPFVVVEEGVTSVWRIGAPAVCLFGKTMSMFQQNLLARTWGGIPIFLILDHDAKVEMAQAKALLAQHNITALAIELPDARDPADYTVNDITTMLFEQAEQAGVLQALI
jgi:DNA primase